MASTLTVTPSTQTANVPLAWSQTIGGAKATSTTGSIDFTDTDSNARPTANITGAPIIVAKNNAGQDITSQLTPSQLAILQTAVTITPEAGNTNNGVIDWQFNYQGNYSDLDFLAGKSVSITNTVTVSDQANGLSNTSSVTNTLNLPQYAGIDYRHSAADMLSPSDIKSAGIGMVGEYLGGDNSYLTRAEAKVETSAGLQIFSIYEHAGMDNADYYTSDVALQNGTSDATNALRNAKRVGQPPGSAIYFGIDLDPADFGGDLNGVVKYFAGVKSIFDADKATHYAVGVYGGGDVDQMIKEGTNLATYADLAESTGWAGSKTYTGWNIEQVRDQSLKDHSTDFPSTTDFEGISYIAGDLTQGATGAWGSIYNYPVAKHDFTGNGTSDILFASADPDVGYYAMNDNALQGWRDIGAYSSSYNAVGIGDFHRQRHR